MAIEDNGSSSAVNTASDVTQTLGDAKDTAKAVAKAAKQSGGNLYGFAAAMAKELIKDPELALKVLRTALIAVLAPFLIIVLVIVGFGAAILAFIQQVITDVANYIIENNGSWGNVDWDWTVGMAVAGGHALYDVILGPDNDGHGNSYQIDEGVEVQDEMHIASSEAAAGRVLQKRIAMIRRSAVARKIQYQVLFEGLCTAQAVLRSIWTLVERFFENPDLMVINDVTIYDDMNDVTDLDAAALLCAYSVQKDVSFQDIALIDLRYWIGHYSGIGSLIGLNERVHPRSESENEYIDVTAVNATTEDGSFSEEISLNTSWIRVPKWFGTFVPQYILEQVKQDADMDVRLENGTATQEEINSGMGYEHSNRGTPSYPAGHGIIDDFIVLETNPSLLITGQTTSIREYYMNNGGLLDVDSFEDFVNFLRGLGAYGIDTLVESLEAVIDEIGYDLAEAANDFLGIFGIDPIFDEGVPEVTWPQFFNHLNGKTLTADNANYVAGWFGATGGFQGETSVPWSDVYNVISTSALKGSNTNNFLECINKPHAFDETAEDLTWDGDVYPHLCSFTIPATIANRVLSWMGLSAGFSESHEIDWTEVLDEIGNITIVDIQLHIPLRINHYEDIVTNVIGLWKGPLESYDSASLINRPFTNPEHPNLLKYQWTDERGVVYTRQRGYQYENYLDSLEALSEEYGFGFHRPHYSTGGQAMADKAMEEYELYGEQSESILAPHYWSIYHGTTSSSLAAWCCCFVYCCGIMLDQALGENSHVYVGTEDSALGIKTGGCCVAWNTFENKGVTHHEQSYIPQPGDIIFYAIRGGGPSRMQHVGIVINVAENGDVYTVEGNSSNTLNYKARGYYASGTYAWTDSDGDIVEIYGYASPDYPDSANADDVKVFYLAANTPMTSHIYNGVKVYGRVNAPIWAVQRMMEEVFAQKYQDFYSQLGSGTLTVGSVAFDEAWDALATTSPVEFHKAVFDAYYKVCARDFFEKLQTNLSLNIASHRALRDLAWCAITRDTQAKAYNTFYVCMLDSENHVRSDMTVREIIEAYYRERKSNLNNEFPNEESRQAFIAILDREKSMLLQELGPDE